MKAKASIVASNAAQNNQTGETASTSINKRKRERNWYKVPSCRHVDERTPGSLRRKVRVRLSERQFQEVTSLSNGDHLQLTNSRAAFPTGGRTLTRIFV